ncbi:ribbon-helix-helix domain-containing protein [Ferriphaselus sp. R-1]|uniref:ribbon-helix-helix domain-containing protein n=1 Tax=Ferriphaselus sp. R-1 TaxID=1485544 RepID=UPI00055435C2|nr:ribbon-helix-helix domain-containing protein [Ferriphaselus sp. R-1]
MEKTNLNNEEHKTTAWKRYVEARERDQHPLPAYLGTGKSTQKSRILFVRIQPVLMEQFEREAEARGLNTSEATRELISAWLRQPDQLPIGIPVGK